MRVPSLAVYEFFRSYFAGDNDAIVKRMQALELVGRASSPDALLFDVLGGSDDARLGALAKKPGREDAKTTRSNF